jgi:GxxExxY protein
VDTGNGIDGEFSQYLESALTSQIIGAALEVRREMLPGYSEAVYRNALMIALEDRGLNSEREARVDVRFRGRAVGAFRCDRLVERRVLVETKAGRPLDPSHQAQLLNQMRATGIRVGLLIHFGNTVETRRFVL